jgi:hypothetical protein
MSEPTWTTMHIGGTLPANKIEELLEWAENHFYDKDGDWTEEDVRIAANENRSILLQGQVNYGNPEGLVDFCQEIGLPFWLHFDAGPEWDAGIQTWKPGGQVEECSASAQGSEPVISLQELRRILKDDVYDLKDTVENLALFESDKVPPITIGEPVADEPMEAANG